MYVQINYCLLVACTKKQKNFFRQYVTKNKKKITQMNTEYAENKRFFDSLVLRPNSPPKQLVKLINGTLNCYQ